jgi:hypothetical protein
VEVVVFVVKGLEFGENRGYMYRYRAGHVRTVLRLQTKDAGEAENLMERVGRFL